MKVRVIQDKDIGDCFNVEVKRWYWPFWVGVTYSYRKEDAIEKAKRFSDINSLVVWSNDNV